MNRSAANLLDQLLAVAQTVELEDAPLDFAAICYAAHALALSMLPPATLREQLKKIEAGALRQSVYKFPPANVQQSSPLANPHAGNCKLN
jgi:hypothetical protein